MTPFVYKAMIVGWLDGDTVDVQIDLGFCVKVEQRVRVRGINAPEKNTPEGQCARNHAAQLALPGEKLLVRSHKQGGGDKYGRWLADIQLRDGRDFATEMVNAGHAKCWDGQGAKP